MTWADIIQETARKYGVEINPSLYEVVLWEMTPFPASPEHTRKAIDEICLKLSQGVLLSEQRAQAHAEMDKAMQEYRAQHL